MSGSPSPDGRVFAGPPDVQRRAKLLDALREIATVLRADSPDDSRLTLIARSGRDLADARVAVVLVPNSETGTADVRAVAGEAGRSLLGAHVPLPAPVDVAGRAGPPQPARPVGAGSHLDALLTIRGIGSWLFVPLNARGRQLAVLALGRSADTARCDDRELGELREFAARAAEILDPVAADRIDDALLDLDDAVMKIRTTDFARTAALAPQRDR